MCPDAWGQFDSSQNCQESIPYLESGPSHIQQLFQSKPETSQLQSTHNLHISKYHSTGDELRAQDREQVRNKINGVTVVENSENGQRKNLSFKTHIWCLLGIMAMTTVGFQLQSKYQMNSYAFMQTSLCFHKAAVCWLAQQLGHTAIDILCISQSANPAQGTCRKDLYQAVLCEIQNIQLNIQNYGCIIMKFLNQVCISTFGPIYSKISSVHSCTILCLEHNRNVLWNQVLQSRCWSLSVLLQLSCCIYLSSIGAFHHIIVTLAIHVNDASAIQVCSLAIASMHTYQLLLLLLWSSAKLKQSLVIGFSWMQKFILSRSSVLIFAVLSIGLTLINAVCDLVSRLRPAVKLYWGLAVTYLYCLLNENATDDSILDGLLAACLVIVICNFAFKQQEKQFMPMTGQVARVRRAFVRQLLYRTNMQIAELINPYIKALSLESALFCTGWYRFLLAVILACSEFKVLSLRYRCPLSQVCALYHISEWVRSGSIQRFSWRHYIFLALCIMGCNPVSGMDSSSTRNVTPARISEERFQQLNRQRWNSNSRSQHQARASQSSGSSSSNRHGMSDLTSANNLNRECEVPQPRRLDDIFAQCRNDAAWIPPEEEAIRISNAIRQRESRQDRNNRRNVRARNGSGVQDIFERSFNTPQVPDGDMLEGYAGSNPNAALLLFHETGGLWRFSNLNSVDPEIIDYDLQQELCSPERITRLIRSYEKRMGNMKNIYACACCGEKRITCEDSEEDCQYITVPLTSPMIQMLRLSYEQEAWYQSLGEYGRAVSAWPQTRELDNPERGRFWLHPELVESGDQDMPEKVRLCKFCHSKLKGQGNSRCPELPEHSIANGVDFENPDRLNLPELTLVEMYLIAPIRLYGSVIKLKAFEKDGDVRVLNGHIIAFQQLSNIALSEISSMQYPRVHDVRRLVSVSFLGDRGQLERMLNGGDSRIPRELTVRPDTVFQWLGVLTVLNPGMFPPGSIIIRNNDIDNQMMELTRILVSEISLVDKIGQQMNEELESDTARVRFGTQQLDEDVEEAFRVEQFQNNTGTDEIPGEEQMGQRQQLPMAASFLRSNTDSTGGAGNLETARILQTMRSTITGREVTNERNNAHNILRDRDPVNEFTDNRRLMLGAFPTLFLLGKGLKYAGSVPKRAAEHMILQFHGHFACNRWLLFALMNQHMRHSAARAASAAVNMHPEAAAEFAALAEDEDFIRQVTLHSEQPDTPQAKALAANLCQMQKIYSSCRSKSSLQPCRKE